MRVAALDDVHGNLPEVFARVHAWPAAVELDVDGIGPVLFCRASRRSDVDGLTEETPDGVGAALVAGVAPDVVLGSGFPDAEKPLERSLVDPRPKAEAVALFESQRA